jgi:hypothetical protein
MNRVIGERRIERIGEEPEELGGVVEEQRNVLGQEIYLSNNFFDIPPIPISTAYRGTASYNVHMFSHSAQLTLTLGFRALVLLRQPNSTPGSVSPVLSLLSTESSVTGSMTSPFQENLLVPKQELEINVGVQLHNPPRWQEKVVTQTTGQALAAQF